jgi:hypothetical protein
MVVDNLLLVVTKIAFFRLFDGAIFSILPPLLAHLFPIVTYQELRFCNTIDPCSRSYD